jgi:two-component system, OmpR family, sensor histidine kinase KdpD
VDERGFTRRGELRVYLGAAPGVGKTFAMLGEGRRRASRGTDVVVGLVETHGREKTALLLEGMEVVPRRTVVHRGMELSEMDVDAVLARRPQVALVDELAHTNVPGSRNAKRWQDIEELLEAGITVLSTVNVQHLESLNDVVERITGIGQRETVPDEVVRRAEQVELVDITPEALRRRMAHGNVYPAHRVDAALSNYFRLGNLTALRELALLWVADQVDVALQRYRAEQHITDTWEARERVVVAVTGGPESETLIRRAARIAARTGGGEVLVLHILRGDGLAGAPPAALARVRTLATDVGATFHTVVGDDVPSALLEFARGVNATQLVLGTSRRSRLARLFDEGIGAAVVQDSGPIDVHMVTHDEAGGLRLPSLHGAISQARKITGWALALLLPLAATGVGIVGRELFDLATDVVLFFLAIVGVALVGGLGPALVAAAASGLLLNYFFTPPIYSLTIAEPTNVVTVLTMVLVAVMVALVVDRAARRAMQAAQARTEAALLASYARTVLTGADPVRRLLTQVRENFGLSSVTLLARSGDDRHRDNRPGDRHRDGWQQVAWTGTDPCSASAEADTVIIVDDQMRLAIRGRPLTASDRAVLEAAAGQAVLALRQQRAAEQALIAQRHAETTELRTALLSAVGHDLRTPLTSIKAAVASLRDRELRLSAADTAELLATIEESTDRLTGLVENLLDSSRLVTGAVRPQLLPVGYDEVVARALATVDRSDAVAVEITEDLPPVLGDPGLLERVVANVVDNALRHGQGAAVEVRGSTHAGRVELRICDHGPGLPRGATETVFAPFQSGLTSPTERGDRQAANGIGLGLSVAKGFMDAMGGTLSAEDTPGGGLTVVVSLAAAHGVSETVVSETSA